MLDEPQGYPLHHDASPPTDPHTFFEIKRQVNEFVQMHLDTTNYATEILHHFNAKVDLPIFLSISEDAAVFLRTVEPLFSDAHSIEICKEPKYSTFACDHASAVQQVVCLQRHARDNLRCCVLAFFQLRVICGF